MSKCANEGCGHLWSHHLNVQADGSADEWRGTHCTIPGCLCPRFVAAEPDGQPTDEDCRRYVAASSVANCANCGLSEAHHYGGLATRVERRTIGGVTTESFTTCTRFVAASEPVIEVCPSCGRRNPKVREYDYNDGPEGYVWVRCDACGDDWCQPSEATLQAARDGVLTVAQPPVGCVHNHSMIHVLSPTAVRTIAMAQPLDCHWCGTPMVVHTAAQWADVRALVEKWRAGNDDDVFLGSPHGPRTAGRMACADELERVTKGEG